MIHHSLAEEQVDLSKYDCLPKSDMPCLILGTIIKHRYDEERLFNNIDNIKAVRIGDSVIKGIELYPNTTSNFDLLFAQLKAISDECLYPEFYEKTLQSFGLSSSECYGLLREGVYPVNGEFISKLTNTDHQIMNFYKQCFEQSTDCAWQKFSYLTLFILFNKS